MATDLLTPNAAAPDAAASDEIGEINKYDFRTESKPVFRARKGLDAEIVSQISEMKNEPAWMRDFRLKSLDIFHSKPMPKWGGAIQKFFGTGFHEAAGAKVSLRTAWMRWAAWVPVCTNSVSRKWQVCIT